MIKDSNQIRELMERWDIPQPPTVHCEGCGHQMQVRLSCKLEGYTSTEGNPIYSFYAKYKCSSFIHTLMYGNRWRVSSLYPQPVGNKGWRWSSGGGWVLEEVGLVLPIGAPM